METLRLEERDDDLALLWIDVKDESVNTLRPQMADELQQVLDQVEGDDSIQGLILASAKEDTFVVGADVNMLNEVTSAEEGRDLSRIAQKAADGLENLSIPVVVAIHGTCLGGGLELALACDARVASGSSETELGLPEVQLGVIPGAGGSQRLPRVVGAERGLTMILQSKRYGPERSLSIGLVDEVVPKDILIQVAAEWAQRLARGEERPDHHQSLADRMRSFFLERTAPGRKLLFNQARQRTKAETHGNYPAPLRAIDVIETGFEEGRQAGFEAEAEAFGELLMTPEAKELIRLFFVRQELKKDPGVDDLEGQPAVVGKVGILGGGLMGSGIAYISTAKAGRPVRLKEIDLEQARAALSSYRSILDNRVDRGRMSSNERDELLSMFTTTTDYDGFGDVDLVIEAVFEDLDIKQQVLKEVQQVAPGSFIFASNTSSIPISQIAQAADKPERVIGMHYFSPVPRIPLLEVVRTDQTADEVIATAVEFGKKQGKIVIVVGDGPGFYTSRILAPYINEAARLVGEGVPVDRIDQALVEFGFPVGPIKLLDEVGIDVAHKISVILQEGFGERMAPPPGLDKVEEEERYGKKVGKGFYRYQRGDDGDWKSTEEVDQSVYSTLNVEPTTKLSAETIVQRCVLAMVNEAARCYQEGIVRSARDADAGAVFGLGFPPFLGGPLRYIENRGAGEILEELNRMESEHGPQFAAAEVLSSLAEQDKTFG